ncbi:MAG: hypothetical protein AAF108_06160 [Planctomycetota bacterium]
MRSPSGFRLLKPPSVDWQALTRTSLAVTVITVLVWLFAEGESLQTVTVSVPVRIEAGDSGFGVRTGGAELSVVRLEVEGPSATVARLRSEGGEPVLIVPDAAVAGISPEPGSQAVDLASALSDRLGLSASGVRVVSIDPREVEVEVVRLVDVEIPVVPILPDGFAGQIVSVDPPTVSAVMTEQSRDDLVESGDSALALPTDRMLAGVLPGRSERLNQVPLRLPDAVRSDPFLRPSSSFVSVVVRVNERRVKAELRAVPIRVLVPAVLSREFAASPAGGADTIDRVEVSGPVGLIERIEAGEIRVYAIAKFDATDVGPSDEQEVTAQIQFSPFDPELSPLSFVSEPREILVRLLRRPRPAGTGTDGLP